MCAARSGVARRPILRWLEDTPIYTRETRGSQYVITRIRRRNPDLMSGNETASLPLSDTALVHPTVPPSAYEDGHLPSKSIGSDTGFGFSNRVRLSDAPAYNSKGRTATRYVVLGRELEMGLAPIDSQSSQSQSQRKKVANGPHIPVIRNGHVPT